MRIYVYIQGSDEIVRVNLHNNGLESASSDTCASHNRLLLLTKECEEGSQVRVKYSGSFTQSRSW